MADADYGGDALSSDPFDAARRAAIDCANGADAILSRVPDENTAPHWDLHSLFEMLSVAVAEAQERIPLVGNILTAEAKDDEDLGQIDRLQNCHETAWRHAEKVLGTLWGPGPRSRGIVRRIGGGDLVVDAARMASSWIEICAALLQLGRFDSARLCVLIARESERAKQRPRSVPNVATQRFPADALWRELDDAAVRIEHGQNGAVEFLRGFIPSTPTHLNSNVLNQLAAEAGLRVDGPLVEYDGVTATLFRPYGATPISWSGSTFVPSTPLLVVTALRDWRDLRARQLSHAPEIPAATSVASAEPRQHEHWPGVIVDRVHRTVKRHSQTAQFGKKEKPFALFLLLFDNPAGISRAKLRSELWPSGEITDNAFDQLKGAAENLILPLGIEFASESGVWTLNLS